MKLNYFFFIRLTVLYICVWALTGPTAYAGKCTESVKDRGTYSCSGKVDKGNDKRQQVLDSNVSLEVSTAEGFGIDVADQDIGHYAIDLRTIDSDRREINVTFTDDNKSSITGGHAGIQVLNNSLGFTEVITTGSVKGVNGYGIFVVNSKNSSKPITIDARGDVSGGKEGIFVVGKDVKITTHGKVSSGEDGISIMDSNSVNLTIKGTVTGETNGIIVYNNKNDKDLASSANITVSGPVIGKKSTAIFSNATTTNITLNRGAVVDGSLRAIETYAKGVATVVVNAGAKVIGEVSLYEGTAHFTVNGGDISGVTLLKGGLDTPTETFIDVLTFRNITLKRNSGDIIYWEKVIVGEGATFTWTGHPLAVGKGSAGTGLFNRGTLSMQDDRASNTMKLNGNYVGEDNASGQSGMLLLDVDFDKLTSDYLEVSGSVKGKSIIKVNDITDITSGRSSATGEMVVVKALNDSNKEDEDFSIDPDQRYNNDSHKGRFKGSSYAWKLETKGNNWILASGDILVKPKTSVKPNPSVVNGEDKVTEKVSLGDDTNFFTVNDGDKVKINTKEEVSSGKYGIYGGSKDVTGEVSLGDGTDIYTVDGGDISGVTLLDGGDDTGLLNMEALSLQNDKAGETLKLSGNYTGKGGTLLLDVDFDKLRSDSLEISGSIKGKTIIKVNDITNITRGKSSREGEMVVVKAPNDIDKKDEDFLIVPSQRYNNDSHKGRFKGSSYAWKLETKGNNWILASGDILIKPKTLTKLKPPAKPKTLVKQDPPVGSMAPVKPKQSFAPAILAEIPAYTTLPTIGREITFNELDVLQARMSKLHTRMGELRNNTSDQATTGTVSPDQGSWSAWTKATINQFELGTGSSFDADGTYGGVAIGFDKRFTLANNWHLFGGIFGGRNSGDFNTSGKGNRYTSHESADLDVVTRSIGVYGSFLNGNGTYVDTVAQYFVLDADINAAGLKSSVEGNAVAASIEAGHGFDLVDGWILEPQAQLRLSRVTWDNFNDGTNDVSFDDRTYVTGGIGARFAKSFSVGAGEVKPWLYAGINHEFTDASSITYAKHSFDAHDYATTIATRLGVMADLTRSIQLYGDVGYSADLDDYNAVRGDLGLRFTW